MMAEMQAKHQNAQSGSSYASQPTPPHCTPLPHHSPPHCTLPSPTQSQPSVVPQQVQVI